MAQNPDSEWMCKAYYNKQFCIQCRSRPPRRQHAHTKGHESINPIAASWQPEVAESCQTRQQAAAPMCLPCDPHHSWLALHHLHHCMEMHHAPATASPCGPTLAACPACPSCSLPALLLQLPASLQAPHAADQILQHWHHHNWVSRRLAVKQLCWEQRHR